MGNISFFKNIIRGKNSEQDQDNYSWNQKNPVTFVFKSVKTPHTILPVPTCYFQTKDIHILYNTVQLTCGVSLIRKKALLLLEVKHDVSLSTFIHIVYGSWGLSKIIS